MIRDNNGKNHTIYPEDFDVQLLNAEERKMGSERGYQATYADEENGFEIIIDFYEYPEGVYDSHEIMPDGCSVIKDDLGFDFDISESE